MLMSTIANVKHIYPAKPTLEGAGVKLRRCFGNNEVPKFDPFLLLDDFSSPNRDDYIKGFPWHPHRGIETVTYILSGRVDHGDSLGNSGSIGPGEVQWMTAGRGIVHQEMPQDTGDPLIGFQLWVNLPQKEKMRPPAYRGITEQEIPQVQADEGALVKVIAGEYDGVTGPVEGIPTRPLYFHVILPQWSQIDIPVGKDRFRFCYVINGACQTGRDGQELFQGTTAVFEKEEVLHFRTRPESGSECSLLVAAGTILDEPVAWGGPIVMNTREELEQAFQEYQAGTFLGEKQG